MPTTTTQARSLQPFLDESLLEPYSPERPTGGVNLLLDANEGAAPPPEVLEALQSIDADLIRRYPDASALERRIARDLHVEADRVIVTAGGDDAIDRCCRLMLGPGRRIIMPKPSFEMIARSARLRGAAVEEIAWPHGPFPTDAFIDACDAETSILAVVTPNNPTGAVARAADLQRLSAAAPQALLLVDLAYTEFADEDLTSTALSLRNAVAIRTFSKVGGLAGLRVGYAISTPQVIRWLRAVGGPYPTSSLSLLLAAQWLERGREASHRYVEEVRRERSLLRDLLLDLGAQAEPSEANFVLARVDDAPRVHSELKERGVAVRRFRAEALHDALRITCPGNPDEFDRLCTALREVISKETTP